MAKVALSFGVFDGLHAGHLYFLEKAREQADELMISLARDEVVLEMKGKEPMHPFVARKKSLEETGLVDGVIMGDYETGAFRSVSVIQPQIICIGYDQSDLCDSLKLWMKKFSIEIPMITIESYMPDKYKTSLLNPNIKTI